MQNFCDCKYDGECPRYGRVMSGRMREICRGINVDLGTAALFREQWKQESRSFILPETSQCILLRTKQAPGDAVAMTAAIYSLHKAHPYKYITSVDSSSPEVFEHNPHVSPLQSRLYDVVEMHYPAIHQSNQRGIHFMQGWCEHLGRSLGVDVPLLTNRPHLYFDNPDPLVGDVWLICSGGKKDFTNKLWGQQNYQEVVDTLKGQVTFIQVGRPEEHEWLKGTLDARGTTLRELFDLCHRSRGVLCGVSLLMHVAAALEKVAIVIAGGREPVQWNAYPKQQYLHTVGMLPCTTPQGDSGACWRSRTVPLGDGTLLDKDTCLRPVNTTPECMSLISPAHVANLILRYNDVYEGNKYTISK